MVGLIVGVKSEEKIREQIAHIEGLMSYIDSPEYVMYLNMHKRVLEWVLEGDE